VPSDDHGQPAPRDGVLDVDPPELARDRAVFLRRVRGRPAFDPHGRRRAVIGGQDDARDRPVGRDPAKRLDGRALEREDVCGLVSGEDERGCPQRVEHLVRRERRVLQIVDQHLVERCRPHPRRLGAAGEQAGEVEHAAPRELRTIRLVEPSELVPSAQPAPFGARGDVLRREQPLAGAKDELPQLVREPVEVQQRAVRRPPLGMVALLAQELFDERELAHGIEHVRRLAVPERLEPLGEEPEREAVDRRDPERRERAIEAPEKLVLRLLARPF
jgi:hypothetical protein